MSVDTLIEKLFRGVGKLVDNLPLMELIEKMSEPIIRARIDASASTFTKSFTLDDILITSFNEIPRRCVFQGNTYCQV